MMARRKIWDDTRAYLAAHGFTNVELSKNEVNQGTVINTLHAVELAKGGGFMAFHRAIMYDAATIRWVLEMLRKDAPQVALGNPPITGRKVTARFGCSCPVRHRLTALPYGPPTTITKAIRRNVLFVR